MNVRASGWFANVQLSANPAMRLFCFPYAGGSSVTFHNWRALLPEGVDVFPVQLPGRGMRLSSKPFTRLHSLIQELLPVMREYLDLPLCFFGHSMGGVIAFELAQALSHRFKVEPDMLFVSARKAPGLPDPEAGIYHLPREEFICRLKALNGTHPDLLSNEEVVDLVLPALRADFELVQTYTPTGGPPLNCAITAFGGIDDNHTAEHELKGWSEFTRGAFSCEMLPGDHFFIQKQQRRLLACLSTKIEQCLESRRGKLVGSRAAAGSVG